MSAQPTDKARTPDDVPDGGPGSGHEPGRRERKKAATRASLERAAFDLFMAHGYRATKVVDIAEAADVSEATFFRYFPSKEDIALTGFRRRVRQVIGEVRRRPIEEPPLTACINSIGSPGAVAFQPGTDQLLEAKLALEAPELLSHYLWIMAEAQRELAIDFAARMGAQPHELGPRLRAAAVIGAISAVFEVWLVNPFGADPQALAEQAFRDLAAGLEPDPP